MNNRHVFSFAGGRKLTTMAASWFVSYMYHQAIDERHDNWKLVPTYKKRISVFSRTKNYHKAWLQHISQMKDKNLDKNSIKLQGEDIRNMAANIYALMLKGE